ncbi:lipopolysaccharide biosynthesis protein [Halobacillus mangrovi]|uniref:lipopolysaccharide biosynthesis protein n=1 Tax=Halobacillus mangrovi TaxID=402384 RepID=UPI003D960D47
MLERFLNNKYLKNVTVMFSGAIISQIMTVLISPLLTRIYTPGELGQFTIFLTICTLILPILNARYDLLIVSVKDRIEANTLVTLSFIISLVILSLVSITIIIINIFTYDIFGINIIYLYFLIPFILIGSMNNILKSYMNRLEHYHLMSKVLVMRSSTQAVMQIAFGALSFNVIGLIIAYVVSYFSGFIIQIKMFLRHYKISSVKLFETFVNYKNQILFSTPSIFINGLSYSIIIFLISNLYSPYEVGMYSITVRVLGLPLTFISLSFSRVFFEKAARDYNSKGEFKNLLQKTTLVLLVISIPVFILLTFISPSLFPLIFGEQWVDAGIYVSFLAPMYAIRLIVSTVSLSIIIISKQKVELLLQTCFVVSCVVVYFITNAFDFDITLFLSLISFTFSLNYIVFYIYLYKNSVSKNHPQND